MHDIYLNAYAINLKAYDIYLNTYAINLNAYEIYLNRVVAFLKRVSRNQKT